MTEELGQPVADERLCRDCRRARAGAEAGSVPADRAAQAVVRGAAAVRAALRGEVAL
ncbi:hypothetical protein [Streptomyces sp. UG1]|uniref:hypothetical protein n=1 Tax=Streptomyces sp. UG1 TaxID=3417652 RepID=UPI003CF84D7D